MMNTVIDFSSIDMFLSKQFRNFAHSKAVYSVFCDCIFEATHANSLQISYSILEILPKKVCCISKMCFAHA